jgi:hypothetical protein
MSGVSSTKNQRHKSKKQSSMVDDDMKILEEFKRDADDLSKHEQNDNESSDYKKQIEEIKRKQQKLRDEISRLESSPQVLGKNGKLSYSAEVTEKIVSLRKELSSIKAHKSPSEIKKSIKSQEEDMLSVARREMQTIKNSMGNFFNNVVDKQQSEELNTDAYDVNIPTNTRKRRNSISSVESESSDNSIRSYQSTSSEQSNNLLQNTDDEKPQSDAGKKSYKSEPLVTEKDIIAKADFMWKTVKDYVKTNPKFKDLQDKKKLEIFRERLGFETFMEEFPIVSRYMICMGQYKTRAFQRFLDKIKRAKHPPPNERPKNYMEDQWIRWQADYVQYLWEEYQRRHYNNAERQWVWQETYKRLKGEFDDFRKMHEDIEDRIKEEKELLAAKNARELLERLKSGSQQLKPEEEEKLLNDLRDLVIKKNFSIVMQELLRKRQPTEVTYDFAIHPLVSKGAILLPCCGKLQSIKDCPKYTICKTDYNQVVCLMLNSDAFKPDSNKEMYDHLLDLKQQAKEGKLDADKAAELEGIQKQYNFEAYHKLCRYYRAITLFNNYFDENVTSRYTEEEHKKSYEIVDVYVKKIMGTTISSSWTEPKIPVVRCQYCNGNLNNFDSTYRSHYLPYIKGTGTGNTENAPKITMIETVDVNRMNEIDDKYRPKELKGMEPILEEENDTEDGNTQ